MFTTKQYRTNSFECFNAILQPERAVTKSPVFRATRHCYVAGAKLLAWRVPVAHPVDSSTGATPACGTKVRIGRFAHVRLGKTGCITSPVLCPHHMRELYRRPKQAADHCETRARAPNSARLCPVTSATRNIQRERTYYYHHCSLEGPPSALSQDFQAWRPHWMFLLWPSYPTIQDTVCSDTGR